MRIIVDIHLGVDSRPTGTVRAADRGAALPFSGNLEFLALIERLYESQAGRIEGHDPQEES